MRLRDDLDDQDEDDDLLDRMIYLISSSRLRDQNGQAINDQSDYDEAIKRL
jgi:hypothetical protein